MGHFQVGELPEYCWMCNCRFKTFEACVEHMDAQGHSFWQFLDETGDESLPVQEEVDEHVAAGHWDEPLACDSAIEAQSAVDPQWSANPQAGQQHEDNMTDHEVDMRTIKCDSCDHRFDTLKACYEHEDALGHGYKEFICEICNRGFRSPEDPDKHIEEDHYPKPFKCETCPATYRTENLRAQHMGAEDHYVKSFQCETCPEAFYTQDQRAEHQKSLRHYHRLHCTICNTYFATRNKLQQHLETHKTKSLVRKSSIDHVDGKSCTFCTDTFDTAWSLARHIELSICPWGSGLDREKIWQYYRKCDPQGVFTEDPDSQYDKEQGETVLAWIDTVIRKNDRLKCYICHDLFRAKHTFRDHMIMRHMGQKEMYHCPKRAECPRGKKPFDSLQAFFRHLGGWGCASLNLRTVLRTVTGSDWPQDTTREHLLGQMLNCLKN